MTTTPRVTAILPVLNGARFIAAAIDSVRAQSLRPTELLVIDGGSTDGTLDVVRAFDDPLVQLIPQSGRGIPAAWNQGIRCAIGDYIAFLSADDFWTPGKLSRQLALMEAQPSLQYTLCLFRYELVEGIAAPAGFNQELLGRELVGRIMETLVARRALFDSLGGFDEGLATAEDVDWYARAAERAVPHAVIQEVGLVKRIHDANASMNAAENTPRLLDVLRRSIARRRAGETDAQR